MIYDTFKDAHFVMGLLHDKKDYIDVIVESSNCGIGAFLRKLFATLLFSKQLSKPEIAWQKIWEYLGDDILHR